MGIRDTLRTNAQPLLHSGEEIQAVFCAQAASPYWSILSYWIIIAANAYRIVIATNERILVCRSSRFRVSSIKGVLRELPRATEIGPASGLWFKTDTLGETVWIHRRYQKDIAAADGARLTGHDSAADH